MKLSALTTLVLCTGISTISVADCLYKEKTFKRGDTITIYEPRYYTLNAVNQKLYKDSHALNLVCTPSISAVNLESSKDWTTRKIKAIQDTWVLADPYMRHQKIDFSYEAPTLAQNSLKQ